MGNSVGTKANEGQGKASNAKLSDASAPVVMTSAVLPGSSTPSPVVNSATSEPPKPSKRETVEEKVWRKFTQHPLVPIGCVATAYFLASGIKSFQNRDPVMSQRMMRSRVAAQFATIIAFIGYMGVDQFDFRLAPMYQDAKKAQAVVDVERESQQQQQQGGGGGQANLSVAIDGPNNQK